MQGLEHATFYPSEKKAEAPRYNFDRRNRTRLQKNAAKLSHAMVADLRRWSRREGFGLCRTDQARALQQTVYGKGLSEYTIYQLLGNDTWFDPTYEPGTPDLEYWQEQLQGSTQAQVVQLLLRRLK
jgi:hypothetical protein